MTLSELFERTLGHPPVSAVPLPASGSHRRYVRLSDGVVSVMGVEGTDAAENKAFVGIDRHLASKGIKVPEVMAVSEDGLCYIQEDLGTESLFDAIAQGRTSGRYSSGELDLLRRTISALPRIQFEGARGLDWELCYPTSEYGRRQVLFDLNYFKYDFLKIWGVQFDEEALQDDLDALCEDILSEEADVFMYRDFSPRNVMVRDGEPWFIDFQGGRRGTIFYDVASFVWQARSAYPREVKDLLIDSYLQALRPYRQMDRAEFMEHLMPFVLLRCLQTLGAYGFRGLVEGKEHFIASIPSAIEGIKSLLPLKYPCLGRILDSLDISGGPAASRSVLRISQVGAQNRPVFAPEIASGACGGIMAEECLPETTATLGTLRGGTVSEASGGVERSETVSGGHYGAYAATGLTIEVLSFSYRRGLPEDTSGNGGGYIFDCRSIHNPGRYEQYKSLTGRNQAVIDFIESGTEMSAFLDNVFGLLDAHIRKYLKRGFSHLQVAFGCTGGQHRSVYAAEHAAQWVSHAFPGVRVILRHREQGVETVLVDGVATESQMMGH